MNIKEGKPEGLGHFQKFSIEMVKIPKIIKDTLLEGIEKNLEKDETLVSADCDILIKGWMKIGIYFK